MIYLFHGSNILAKKKKSQKVLSSFNPGQVLSMTDLDWSPELVENIIYGDSLFDPKEAIVFNGILENNDVLNFILSQLENMMASSKTFIFLEKKLVKEIISKFQKAGAEIEEFTTSERGEPRPQGGREKVNPFAVTYSIGSRDKKNTWINFVKIIQSETEPEALAGIFFWKIKSMILEKDTKKYSEQELKELSSKIISIYHESHRGQGDIETGLERLILEYI